MKNIVSTNNTNSGKKVNRNDEAKRAEVKGIIKTVALVIVLIAAFVGGYITSAKQSEQTQNLQAETTKAEISNAAATGYNAGYAQAKTDLGK